MTSPISLNCSKIEETNAGISSRSSGEKWSVSLSAIAAAETVVAPRTSNRLIAKTSTRCVLPVTVSYAKPKSSSTQDLNNNADGELKRHKGTGGTQIQAFGSV